MMLDEAGRNLIGLGPLRDGSPEQITRLLRPCFEALIGIPGGLSRLSGSARGGGVIS